MMLHQTLVSLSVYDSMSNRDWQSHNISIQSSSNGLVYTIASPSHLPLILSLQTQNHPSALTTAEIASAGFVTVLHTPDILERMNIAAPSIVALDRRIVETSDGATKVEEVIAGYCLMTPLSFVQEISFFHKGIMKAIAGRSFKGRPLSLESPKHSATSVLGPPLRWFIMGQVLVSSKYRGSGVFDEMYLALRERYMHDYDFVFTEVSSKNPRSLRAHLRVGFTELGVHDDGETDQRWHSVVWDWTLPMKK